METTISMEARQRRPLANEARPWGQQPDAHDDDRRSARPGKRRRSPTVRWLCLAAGACTCLAVAHLMGLLQAVSLLVVHPPDLTDDVQLRRFTVSVDGLHPSLHGLKIAQMTDIHYNDGQSAVRGTSDDLMRQAVELIERDNVDLVVLTGDYVDEWPEAAPALAARWLSRLRSRHGTLAILGNHDYQKPQSKHLVLKAMALANVTVLVNSRAEPINDWLEVIGIGERSQEYHPHLVMYPLPPPVAVAAEEGRAAGGGDGAGGGPAAYRKARIVLTHNPDSAINLTEWGADLILSGHTHGGVSCLQPLPRTLFPFVSWLPRAIQARIPGARAVQHWHLSYGWNSLPRLYPELLASHEPLAIRLYTSNGLDQIPRFRRVFFCPPEVVVFTLVPGSW